MRPTKSGGKLEDLKEEMKDRTILIVVIIVVVCVIVGSVYAISYYDVFSDSYFRTLELEEEEISSGETTTLKVQLINPREEKNISDFSVEVSTEYTKLDIFRGENGIDNDNVNNFVHHTFSSPEVYLPGDGSAPRHFYIRGELPPGLNYLESNIEIKVFADGELVEKKVLELAVSS